MIKLSKFLPLLFLFLIVVVGSWFRLYRFSERALWAGDQGRDILVAKKMVEERKIYLVSPDTSDPSSLLKNSPVYFIVIAFLWLLAPSAMGVTLFFIAGGIATIFIAYLVGKEIASKEVGLITALVVAIHHLFIGEFWIWSPHFISFFTALTLFLVFKGTTGKKYYLFLATGVSFFALHLHYSALPVLPIVILISCIELINQWRIKRTIIYLYAIMNYIALLIFEGAIWLVLSFKGSPENLLVFSSGASKSLINFQTLSSNFLGNSQILFGPLFLQYETRAQLIIFSFILLGLGVLAYFLYKKGKPFKNILYLLAFNLSFFFTCIFKAEVSYHYFTAFFFIFWFSIIVLFFSISNPWKITSLLKWLLIFYFARIIFLDSNQNQILWRQNSYQLFSDAAEVIKQSQKDDPNFVVYVYTSMATGYPIWDSPAVCYHLEEKMQKNLVSIIPNYNNVLPNAVEPHVGYVICTHIFSISSQVVFDCEIRVKEYLSETGLDTQKMTFSKIDDHGEEYAILKVESAQVLPKL